MNAVVLALNAGSSSLKFGLFGSSESNVKTFVRGTIRLTAEGASRATASGWQGDRILSEEWPTATVDGGIERLLGWIERSFKHANITAVGHRIVHGGAEFAHPVVIDHSILAKLHALTPLAPLHQPACLEPIRIIERLRPDLPQIACFDTAFHRTMQPPANQYALPPALEKEGVRRYGFHGLSYESIARQLADDPETFGNQRTSRVIVAHLGNGASLCAMRDLKSVDTTMGFSTLDGLVMGTRPGSVDPGILLYLLKAKGISPDRLEDMFYHESGLLGVSGISSDVATLLQSHLPEAAAALELYAFQAARHISALAATLGGMERLVFTAGVGENAPAVRAMIVQRLEWLGADLDGRANAAGELTISSDRSAVLIEQRPTNEELAIARQVCGLMRGAVGNHAEKCE